MAKIKRYNDEFKKPLVDLQLAYKTHSDLCRVLHANQSTYYNFINKSPSKREIENQRFRNYFNSMK